MSNVNYQTASWVKDFKQGVIPSLVSIDLTNICNQDCYYCNTAEFRKSQPVQKNYVEYIQLLDQIVSWPDHHPYYAGKVMAATYAGSGEPTLLKGYEHVIEHSIDLGFDTSMSTNGSYLNKLVESVNPNKLKKINYIGVDVDAGSEPLYEKIRRTIPKKSLFDQVVNNIQELTNIGVNVDLKILLGEYNNTPEALQDIFALAKKCNVRSVLFRPVTIGNTVFSMEPIATLISELSIKFQVNTTISQTKFITRNYNRCHQMFQRATFCADGKIYVCCENKGNSTFCIGDWDQPDDFRDVWLGKQHRHVYNSVNTNLCPPCGPNFDNVKIQEIINTL